MNLLPLTLVLLIAPAVQPLHASERAANRVHKTDAPRFNIGQLAGHYSFGNGVDLNYELQVSPDGTFSYEQASYLGTEAEAAGTASLSGNKLQLKPITATSEAWPDGMALDLTVVNWGQRLYLVPEKDMIRFVNAINRGREPVAQVSRGAFFLREGDWDVPVHGLPDLPGKYSRLLLSKPVSGKVLHCDETGAWKVDQGRRCGICPGMELCAWSPQQAGCVTVVVSRVEDNCCYVKCHRRQPAKLANWNVCSRERQE